ncbi:MAG: histidine kinase [Acidimicrobiales bacterium]
MGAEQPQSPVAALLAGARREVLDDHPQPTFEPRHRPPREQRAVRRHPSGEVAAGGVEPAWSAAVLLAPVAVAVALGALAAAAADGVHAQEVLRAVLVVSWAAAGALLATRPALVRLGTLVLVAALLGGFATLGAAGDADGWTGAAGVAARGAEHLGLSFMLAAALHILVALPRGHLPTVVRRNTALAGWGVGAAAGASLWAADVGATATVCWVGWGVVALLGLPASHRSYLSAAGTDRQRLQWLGCGVAVTAEVVLVVAALHALVEWPEHAMVVAGAATLFIPAALAAGASARLIARVDRLLVHTVSIAGLTTVVVGVYLVIVLGLGQVPGEEERHLLVLSMAAAALATILYVPARNRLTEVANRLVYGERTAPDEVLRTFGSRLTRAIPMDELLLQLVESLRKTMALRRAEVWTGSGGVLERSTSVPDAGPGRLEIGPKELPVVARAGVSGNAWLTIWLPALLADRSDSQVRVAPITHAGEVLGLIVVERAADGDQLGEEEDRVLTELARQVGLALHNVQLDSALQASLDEVRRQAEELRASRSRIVATADAERRKIERNLHDGAQQHLVALAVNLRLTKDILADDPAAAAEMLELLAASVKDTIQELRDLAHGIYPPLLVDSGLVEALRAAANRSPLGVRVEVDGVGRHDTEVEAALYFCCLEALQNAAKHAPGSTVVLRLEQDETSLRFEVADDGPGFDPSSASSGHGFVNMSDRLGAIGGTVRWDSTPGVGTTISGIVPLP